MKRIFALSLAAMAIGAATSASAVVFRFQYNGSFDTAGPIAGVDTNAFPGSIVGLPTATEGASRLTYFYPSGTGTFVNGVGTVTSPTGSIQFTFEGDNDATGLDGALMDFFNGTGEYEGFEGTGIISHTVNNMDPNVVSGQFYADIQAVPEPASFAALGLAGVAVLRRRNKNRRNSL